MSELSRLSASAAARRIAEGSATAEALVRSCLGRIAEREDTVGAFIHLEPERALAEARARDGEAPRGPLHGIPVGVKDLMDTADQPTGYGSDAYLGHRPPADAACVALARAAGAVILGKTVTTEFAWRHPGKTCNPHHPGHTPGGSSSGSAAGVADFMMPLAFGTQTAGSVIRPAAYCGVVGVKPSYGTIATAGTKALAHSLDTIGVMARSVADATLFLGALTGHGAELSAAPARPRIGVYRADYFADAAPAEAQAIETAAQRLKAAGAAVTERPRFAPFDGLLPVHNTIMLYEAGRNLAWERRERASLLAEETRANIDRGAQVTAEAYDAARRRAREARAAAAAFFGELDAVLVPAAPGEAPAGTAATGSPQFNAVWTLLHVPCLTLPLGLGPAGLPLGVQLVAPLGADRALLALGAFAEKALAET